MRVVGSRWWWGTPCCRGSVVVAAGRFRCCRSVLVAAGRSLLLPVGPCCCRSVSLLPVRPCCCRSVLVAAGRCRCCRSVGCCRSVLVAAGPSLLLPVGPRCCSYRAGVENERQRELAKGSKKEARRSERGGRSRIAARRGPGAASTSGNSRIAARRGPGAASAAGGLTWRAGLDVARWTGRGVLDWTWRAGIRRGALDWTWRAIHQAPRPDRRATRELGASCGVSVAEGGGWEGRSDTHLVGLFPPPRGRPVPWRKGAVGRGAQARISSASFHPPRGSRGLPTPAGSAAPASRPLARPQGRAILNRTNRAGRRPTTRSRCRPWRRRRETTRVMRTSASTSRNPWWPASLR